MATIMTNPTASAKLAVTCRADDSGEGYSRMQGAFCRVSCHGCPSHTKFGVAVAIDEPGRKRIHYRSKQPHTTVSFGEIKGISIVLMFEDACGI